MGEEFKHIDYAIVAKTHPSMYLMHKYWARKPRNVVSEYIRIYSKEQEIVLDPFCGSGVTVLEAIKLGRKAIGIDLDPMAIFITKCTGMKVDLENLQKAFDNLKERIKNGIYKLYKTQCTSCDKKGLITHLICNFDKNSITDKIIEIWYTCKTCGRKKKKPDAADLKNFDQIEKKKIPYWYPQNELLWNSRINVWKGEKVSDLFSHRALIALSTILNEIEQITDDSIKDILRFAFTSALAQASRLIPVVNEGRECKSWTVRGYWIPEKHFEINAWRCFENRFIKILRGKTESNNIIGDSFKLGENCNDLSQDKTIVLFNQSCLDLANIDTNSVDYIFTDPPYGDSVPYLELNYMWSSWLKFQPGFDEEIIISNSPIRKKQSEEDYSRDLLQAFKESFRILKPNHYLTVTFHNADVGVYNSVIRSIVLSGFELDKILYQPPPRASAKSFLHPWGSATGDYYIRFKKPEVARLLVTESDFDSLRFEKIVVESVKAIIAERGEPVSFNDILKHIYIDLDKAGYLCLAKTENIQKIMKKFEGTEFIFIKGEGWWFQDPEEYFLHITPLQDRLETFVIQTLRRKVRVSYDEIMQDIFLNLKNALTPEPYKIKSILSEYARKSKDNMWQLKPTVKMEGSKHTQLIGYLAKLGKRLGFQIHIGLREQGELFGTEPLSSLIDDGVDTTLSKQLKEIDIVWIKEGKVVYAFEVEYTTSITEAIVRGSYLPKETEKYFIIPNERENLLYKKINAPLFQGIKNPLKWNFIFFEDLEVFFKANEHRKIDLTTFENLKHELKFHKTTQTKLV